MEVSSPNCLFRFALPNPHSVLSRSEELDGRGGIREHVNLVSNPGGGEGGLGGERGGRAEEEEFGNRRGAGEERAEKLREGQEWGSIFGDMSKA